MLNENNTDIYTLCREIADTEIIMGTSLPLDSLEFFEVRGLLAEKLELHVSWWGIETTADAVKWSEEIAKLTREVLKEVRA